MKTEAPVVFDFPCGASPSILRVARRELRTLRSVSSVILNLAGCNSLNARDIDLLLECLASAVGRDTQVILVAGSRSIRVLLEVTRIASLVPIYDSLDQALARTGMTRVAGAATPNDPPQTQFSERGIFPQSCFSQSMSSA